jgi:transcription antitermination protein NusB
MNSGSKHRVLRHNARQCALQAIYQWQLSANPVQEIETQFIQYHITKKVDLDYFKEILHGVVKHQHELDKSISPFIERTLEEVDPIELAILRIATFELAKRIDVPYRVVINEGLELAKKFGSVDGFKFINSALDRIARQLRSHEVK